jgi:hypothetical protein
VVGCRRLPDIRGVAAVGCGGRLTVFAANSTVTIFKGDDPPEDALAGWPKGCAPSPDQQT